jgi:RimJ/RimL family protein N-acetyltransferase
VQERKAKVGEVSRRIVLRTARLTLTRMTPLDEAEHAVASGDAAAALRDTRAAEVQWREYGFGPWAIRDLRDEGFLGGAELRFAGNGIEGIAPDEVEAGWWVTKERRNQGIASEAMHAAIGDLWHRTEAESITAYIEEGDNAASRQLAAKLGFVVRGQGRGRSGEPMTVYELRRAVWQRRGG